MTERAVSRNGNSHSGADSFRQFISVFRDAFL
jgi:hypothetical protein